MRELMLKYCNRIRRHWNIMEQYVERLVGTS